MDRHTPPIAEHVHCMNCEAVIPIVADQLVNVASIETPATVDGELQLVKRTVPICEGCAEKVKAKEDK